MKRAFTLIELMMVITIISILISILSPSLTIAKMKAKDLVCKEYQRSMAKGYIIHSNNGYYYSSTPQFDHDPGQFISTNGINIRIKTLALNLDSYEEMNCPFYTGDKSSFGFNVEQSDSHNANYDDRMFVGEINNTSAFVMMGCRENDGQLQYFLNKDSSKLAQHHSSLTGIVMFIDGHVEVTTRVILENTSNESISLLNN